MKKIVVYLGGDIMGEQWRQRVIDYLGYLAKHVVWMTPGGCHQDLESRTGPDRFTSEAMFFDTVDLMKVDASHILFFYLRDSGSVFSGTSFEAGYGKAKKKTIILINEIGDPVKRNLYEMLTKQATYSTWDFTGGCWMLKSIVEGFVKNLGAA